MTKPDIIVTIGDEPFAAQLLHARAPQTCQQFLSLLPWTKQLVHVRWSGEGCWIPLGDFALGVGPENPTSTPPPGEFLFYPSGISETEILLAYGSVRFGSREGLLAGNPFLRIVEGFERLEGVGRSILWTGAKPISFAPVDHLQ